MLRLISFLVFLMGIAAAVLGWAILTNNVDKLQLGQQTKVAEVTREVWTVEPATASVDQTPDVDVTDSSAANDNVEAAMEDASDSLDDAVSEIELAEATPSPTPAPAAKKTRSLQVEEPVFESSVQPEFSESASAPAFEEVLTGTPSTPGQTASPDTATTSASPEPAIATVPEKTAEEIFLESLRTVPIAHETPNSAGYKQAFDVVLAIDATGDDTAVDALPGRGGTVVEGTVQVSDQVEARLAGAAFGIVSDSPGVQKMSPVTENTWRWSVTPLKAGEHDLVFEIFAVDGDVSTPLRTYRDTVTVEVTGIGHAVAFADQTNPLFVLLGGLGSAIAGLFGVFSFFRKKRA